MSNLDAATYQLLYQLKILTTALFSVILLKKSLNFKQWISLCVLCFGVGLVQSSSLLKPPTLLSSISSITTSSSIGDSSSSSEQEENLAEQLLLEEEEDMKKNSFLGFLAVLAACCSSGLAGVYFEMVLKNAKTSLWIRNIQLSLFGMLLGLLPVINDWSLITEKPDGFFHGYSMIVWIVILLQAGGGILVAIVVKYADNILKGFATSLSIIMSCVASYFIFNFQVNSIFVIGAVLILCAVYVYGNEANNNNNNSNNKNNMNNNMNMNSTNMNVKTSPSIYMNKRSPSNIDSEAGVGGTSLNSSPRTKHQMTKQLSK
jgi:UDP-sugar transporter A1/2/3